MTKENFIICGIDPGKEGGICLIGRELKESDSITIFPMPVIKVGKSKTQYNLPAICSLIKQADYVCIEKQQAMPGQGVTSMFSIGEGFGILKGIITAYGIPLLEVAPKTWKKYFSLSKDKNASIIKAQQLYPTVDLRKTDRCRTFHDGMAEALLLANYCSKWQRDSS